MGTRAVDIRATSRYQTRHFSLHTAGMLSYGEYSQGTGLEGDPMVFTGGSEVSCREVGSVTVTCHVS